MFRVGLDARVSTNDQQSIPMQVRALREYAAKRGWTVAMQMQEVGSGAAQRELREQLVDAARRREIDVVLVWRLDRWGCSLVDLVVTLLELSELGVGLLGVALAFGLTVLTMAYAIGDVSGCHLNPAVSVGLVVAKRFPLSDLLPFVVAQLGGGIAAAAVLFIIASGRPGFDLASGFAANGYDAHSPAGYPLMACLVAEAVLTLMFLVIILGATDRRAQQGFAPIAIGLGLTLIHLVGILVTNLSVNPARSTGPALFVGGWAVQQLWLFWLAPIAGAAIGGALYPGVAGEPATEQTPAEVQNRLAAVKQS
jgi:aquaporin Z